MFIDKDEKSTTVTDRKSGDPVQHGLSLRTSQLRLLQAAPDLLRACQAARDFLGSIDGTTGIETREMCIRAIQKAL